MKRQFRIHLLKLKLSLDATQMLSSIIVLDVDECQNNPCEHNCTNTVGSFMCSCPVKYIVASNGISCAGKLSPCQGDNIILIVIKSAFGINIQSRIMW